jgi:hypothetical protein
MWWPLVVVLVTAGCGAQGLVLRQPDGIRDLKPPALSSTKLPVKLSWTARPLAVGERFVVFVDQAPMPPGDSLESLADDTCKATPGCPNQAYLNQHFVFVTRDDRVELPVLPLQGPFPVNDLYDLHQATIVIIDHAGRRVGEEFWATSFYATTT